MSNLGSINPGICIWMRNDFIINAQTIQMVLQHDCDSHIVSPIFCLHVSADIAMRDSVKQGLKSFPADMYKTDMISGFEIDIFTAID